MRILDWTIGLGAVAFFGALASQSATGGLQTFAYVAPARWHSLRRAGPSTPLSRARLIWSTSTRLGLGGWSG
ncbi:hypothetical protein [Inquilinus limosus]|uniref:hypothetical protein n=1 Tax=Inquilinus limosus TaxID=171674 RepID=UPI0011981FC4|nr:hypothetical protein [Inquilinus limosus]